MPHDDKPIMKIDDLANLEHRKRLFWLFQFLFWSAHSAIYIFNHPQVLWYLSNILPHALSILMGFSLSMGLRQLYKNQRCHQFSPGALISVIVLYSMFCGLLNGVLDRVIGNVSFGDKLYPLHFLSGAALVNLLWSYTYRFVAWSALYIGFKIYEEWVIQRQKAERAEALAQSAQLTMLRYQLNPHFFFNTLSSLLSLISRDAKKAEEIVIKISEFMRYSLLADNQQQVPLRREIEIIRHYLDIEKVRYGEKLIVTEEIDPMAEEYPIPVLLIHSLVENAVKHGIETSPLPLRIRITAEVENGRLSLSVENSGTWIEPQPRPEGLSTGTGLQNTRKRLEHFYPGNHTFEILKEQGVVRVRILLKK
jgi:anti-sigma regulatory factor (Ser/Thr protein kinase)